MPRIATVFIAGVLMIAPDLCGAATSHQDAARLVKDFYARHPNAPKLSGSQHRPVTPAPTPTAPTPSSPPQAPLAPAQETLTRAPAGPPRQLFKIGNDYGVMNGPTRESVFVLDEPTYVTRFTDYHWNNGRGAAAGTISVRASTGQVFGPWPTTLVNGVYWQTSPNTWLPAGRYVVIDSDVATWSQNGGTDGAGMSWAEGVPRAGAVASSGLTGDWTMIFVFNGQRFAHAVRLEQRDMRLTGSGAYPAAGHSIYAWTIALGEVSGDRTRSSVSVCSPNLIVKS